MSLFFDADWFDAKLDERGLDRAALAIAAGVERSELHLVFTNERAATAKLVASLLEGKDVALVSDAGTPALSDPGALLVSEAHRANIRVSPIPGPSAEPV